jgi:transcriptional regulator of NAD metabolism
MGTLVAIIMIILFLVLLAFVFSTALLTPIIGKKNLLFVLVVGFVVGFIGGAFFIAPVIDDIPNIARSAYQFTSTGSEIIKIDASTEVDVNKFIEQTKKIDGVKSVKSSDIFIKTSPFSEQRKKFLEEHVTYSSPSIISTNIDGNDTIILKLKEGTDSRKIIQKLKDWLMLVGSITTKYSIIHITVSVEASKASSVIDEISKQKVVITSIQGPIEGKIKDLKEALPPESQVAYVCGLIGLLTALAGVFIDSILSFFNILKEKLRRS